MRRYCRVTISILVVLIILSLFTLGATTIKKVRITIGEKMVEKTKLFGNKENDNTINLEIPVKIPVVVDISALSPGCGESFPKVITFTGEGVVHVFYNPNTGEKWARIGEIRYECTFNGDDYEVEKMK